MKNYILKYPLYLLLMLAGFSSESSAQQAIATPFMKIRSLAETLQPLPFSSITPAGWLQQQLRENMNGFTGFLDSLVPDLFIGDDIYGKDRLTKKVKSKNVGAIAEGGDWTIQYLWWNSETQSNWWDGYIRTAILLRDSLSLGKARSYIARILATQDTDGYLGIYDPDLRYHFHNENGELWSKTTLLRGLLAWFEYSRDTAVLKAVTRAVDNVLLHYPAYHSTPFYSDKPDAGGVTHGLVFTDVLESLYRLTRKEEYRDYALFMYHDFSAHMLNEDAQYSKLMDTAYALKGHGVHTYEHLRTLAAAYYASGNDSLKIALRNFLNKIKACTLPSGAPASDEFIGGRKADATNTGYEYCSLHELMDGYISLLIKTGDAEYAGKAENIFFNAAQGSRHPSKSAICYLKTDNAWELTGGKNGDKSDIHQTRYRYSPVHKEAAVCCVPNAGRIGPVYIQNMWLKDSTSLVAALLGPCVVSATVNGTVVTIHETTEYPYDNTIRFTVQSEAPVSFALKIRKPAWVKHFEVTAPYTIERDYIVISRIWQESSTITIRVETAPLMQQTGNGEVYFTYGPLVLAHTVESNEIITKRYAVEELQEINYTAINPVVYEYINNASLHIDTSDRDRLICKAKLYNPVTGKTELVDLVPMGKTILRQVTFKQKQH